MINQESYFAANIQKDSVYGAAIALPQIARSGGWPVTFTVMVLRTYLNLFLNYMCQLLLIYVIFQESIVFDPLGGVMNLCSFGSSFENCPNAKNCRGPGGGNYTQSNLIADFGDWDARRFFRDSLAKVFPTRAADIRATADPGEYGMESPMCRWVSLFVFTMAIANDFQQVGEAFYLHYIVPTKADSWIEYDRNETAERVLGTGDIVDRLKFKVAGIPLGWKISNFLFIVIPKLLIWVLILIAGTNFLFNTADIVDLVLNSLAMCFILDLDELILTRLTSVAQKYVLEEMADYQTPRCARLLKKMEDETDEVSIAAHDDDKFVWTDFVRIFPKRFVYVVISMICGYLVYYNVYCEQTADGSWISKTVYAPENIYFAPINALFHTMRVDATPMWEMPAP